MYRAWVEEILGLKRRPGFLVIDPVIPRSWNGFTLTCRFNEAEYVIVVKNPDRVENGIISIELDGKSVRGNRIPLEKKGNHEVNVRMGIPGDKKLS
jgi:cellobiose phosphorylase